MLVSSGTEGRGLGDMLRTRSLCGGRGLRTQQAIGIHISVVSLTPYFDEDASVCLLAENQKRTAG